MASKEMKTLAFSDVIYEIVDEKARNDLKEKIPNSDKGKANGVASLDDNGKVPSNQLPDIPIKNGEGENSIVLTGSNNIAIGDNSVAFGKNNVAGCKGYYIKSIDLENKKIYLCNEQVIPVISTEDNTDIYFETPKYMPDDSFSIVNYTHYYNCGTIVSIQNNVVTYKDTDNLGFASIAEDSEIDAYTFAVHSKPEVGVVAFAYSGFSAGMLNKSTGIASTAIGRNNKAIGDYAFAQGRDTYAEFCAHSEGSGSKAYGVASHAEGYRTQTLADYAHAEGNYSKSLGIGSHVEGNNNESHGEYSHAEGSWVRSYGKYSHSEGYGTRSRGESSHAEGKETQSNGNYSHTEGSLTQTLADYAHAEGNHTKANGESSHAEGVYTQSNGKASHAEGSECISSGVNSHAEGFKTEAVGAGSHAEGAVTYAGSEYQHVQGKFNVKDTENKYAHIVGGGSSDNNRKNIFTLDWQGNAWYQGSITSNGADYAEYFEWEDGNLNNEDRVGLLVTLDGEKIKLANNGDEILGIISGTAAVLGDNYECEWNGKYLTDDFGRVIYDMVEEFVDEIVGEDEDGNPIIEKQSLGFFKHPRINPNYDSDKPYVNRADRQEWDTVGMLGKLYVRDDGTATVNGYITVGENGIATASSDKTNMRVLSRVNENVVRVLLK